MGSELVPSSLSLSLVMWSVSGSYFPSSSDTVFSDTDLAICIDFALHIGRCLRLGLDDADREAQRAVAAAVLDLD